MEECWKASQASPHAIGSSEVIGGGEWQQLMEYSSSSAPGRPCFPVAELSYGSSSTLTQSSHEKKSWVLPEFPLVVDRGAIGEEAKPRNAACMEESLSSLQTSGHSRKRKDDRSITITEAPEEQKTRRQKKCEKEDVKTKAESENSGSTSLKSGKEKPPEAPKQDYIHVRARRGQATDSHSLAERVRREKISERMKFLQDLVPGCSKVTGKAVMLDEIINYVQSLQRQVEFLSMKLAAVNPRLDIMECFLPKEMLLRGSASGMNHENIAYPLQQQLQYAQQALGSLETPQPQGWDCGDLQSVVQMFGSLVNFPGSSDLERLDPSLLLRSK